MENQKNNKRIMILLSVIIVILLVLGILFATGTVKLKAHEVNNNKTNENSINNNSQTNEVDNDNITNDDNLNDENNVSDDNLNDEEDVNTEQNEKYEQITLSKEKETYDFDKLHLDFSGILTEDGNNRFTYVLNIKYDGKDVNSTFFNDKENYRIWSSNMAADFKIYKVENVYILKSFIAKQCFCDEILIFNTNGDVLKTFSTAKFSITDSQNITIETSDNGQCMGDNYEEHITEYKFKIDDFNLIEQ